MKKLAVALSVCTALTVGVVASASSTPSKNKPARASGIKKTFPCSQLTASGREKGNNNRNIARVKNLLFDGSNQVTFREVPLPRVENKSNPYGENVQTVTISAPSGKKVVAGAYTLDISNVPGSGDKCVSVQSVEVLSSQLDKTNNQYVVKTRNGTNGFPPNLRAFLISK